MRINKESSINDVSRKLLVICKKFVSYYLKKLLNSCITSGVYPSVFKIAEIKSIDKKSSLHNI